MYLIIADNLNVHSWLFFVKKHCGAKLAFLRKAFLPQ
jgi:hypothetical protein